MFPGLTVIVAVENVLVISDDEESPIFVVTKANDHVIGLTTVEQ